MMGIMGRTRTATAAAVVMLALLLQLLVPLPVSRAEATPICTAGGVILLISEDGTPPADHAAGKHCQLCLLPRADALPGGCPLMPARSGITAIAALPVPAAIALPPAAFPPYAQRAPPAA